MSDGSAAHRALVEELASVSLVLESYKAVMARSRNEREAFETAVRIYHAHHPNVPETEARHEVAEIICGRQNERQEGQVILNVR